MTPHDLPADVAKLLAKPTMTVPEAGKVFDLSRNAAYGAANRGEIETVTFGKIKRVPTAWVRRKLGLDPVPA